METFSFSGEVTVRTKVEKMGPGMLAVGGQDSRVAPMGAQNRARSEGMGKAGVLWGRKRKKLFGIIQLQYTRSQIITEK